MADAAPPPDLLDYLADNLGDPPPARILLVTEDEAPLAARIRERAPGADCLTLTPAEMDDARVGDQPFDLALVADLLEDRPARAAAQGLGRLRDLYTHRFWLIVSPAAKWTNADLIGYGLRRAGRFDDWRLYRFNIHDYKDVPDWLNSRYWANPERWGRERW